MIFLKLGKGELGKQKIEKQVLKNITGLISLQCNE